MCVFYCFFFFFFLLHYRFSGIKDPDQSNTTYSYEPCIAMRGHCGTDPGTSTAVGRFDLQKCFPRHTKELIFWCSFALLEVCQMYPAYALLLVPSGFSLSWFFLVWKIWRPRLIWENFYGDTHFPENSLCLCPSVWSVLKGIHHSLFITLLLPPSCWNPKKNQYCI